MNDRVCVIGSNSLTHKRAIGDITTHKCITRRLLDTLKTGGGASIGKRIDIHHTPVGCLKNVTDKITSDKAATASD